MKKLICYLVFFSLFAVKIHAQIVPQKVFIGGQVNIYKDDLFTQSTNSSFTITDKAKYSRLTILPSIGYSISEKASIGIEVGYSSIKHNYSSTSSIFYNYDYITNLFHINPFFRTNKLITDNLYFQNKFSVNCSTGKIKSPATGRVAKSFSLRPNYCAGLYFIINSRLGIKLNLGSLYFDYSREVEADESAVTVEDAKSYDFNFDIDFKSIGIGLEYYFK